MSVSSLVWKTAKWGAIALVGGPVLVVLLLVATGPLLSNTPIRIQQNQPVRHFENNYRTGTEGYVLTQLAHEAFPYMDILISDQRFQDQMTEASKVAHPLDSMRLLHRIGQNHLHHAAESRQDTTVLGAMAWEDDFLSLNACVVYLSSNGMARGLSRAMATVLHETIHCSRAKMHSRSSEAFALELLRIAQKMPSFRDPAKLTGKTIEHIFQVSEEAFVTASERSLSFLPGPVGDLARAEYQREVASARVDSRANESPRVAILMESLCAKAGDCPTDTPALSSFLLENRMYIAALEKDILRWTDIRR